MQCWPMRTGGACHGFEHSGRGYFRRTLVHGNLALSAQICAYVCRLRLCFHKLFQFWKTVKFRRDEAFKVGVCCCSQLSYAPDHFSPLSSRELTGGDAQAELDLLTPEVHLAESAFDGR